MSAQGVPILFGLVHEAIVLADLAFCRFVHMPPRYLVRLACVGSRSPCHVDVQCLCLRIASQRTAFAVSQPCTEQKNREQAKDPLELGAIPYLASGGNSTFVQRAVVCGERRERKTVDYRNCHMVVLICRTPFPALDATIDMIVIHLAAT